jgi:hypothetical protein
MDIVCVWEDYITRNVAKNLPGSGLFLNNRDVNRTSARTLRKKVVLCRHAPYITGISSRSGHALYLFIHAAQRLPIWPRALWATLFNAPTFFAHQHKFCFICLEKSGPSATNFHSGVKLKIK